jgi:hypothetical protein
MFFFGHETKNDVKRFMQSDLFENNHQEHFVLIRFINTIHDENFEIESKNFLRTFSRKEEMKHLIKTIFMKRNCSILHIKFMHQRLHLSHKIVKDVNK